MQQSRHFDWKLLCLAGGQSPNIALIFETRNPNRPQTKTRHHAAFRPLQLQFVTSVCSTQMIASWQRIQPRIYVKQSVLNTFELQRLYSDGKDSLDAAQLLRLLFMHILLLLDVFMIAETFNSSCWISQYLLPPNGCELKSGSPLIKILCTCYNRVL